MEGRKPVLRLHGGFARLLAGDGGNAAVAAGRGGGGAEARRAILQEGVSATRAAGDSESGEGGDGGDGGRGDAGVCLLAGAVRGAALFLWDKWGCEKRNK